MNKLFSYIELNNINRIKVRNTDNFSYGTKVNGPLSDIKDILDDAGKMERMTDTSAYVLYPIRLKVAEETVLSSRWGLNRKFKKITSARIDKDYKGNQIKLI